MHLARTAGPAHVKLDLRSSSSSISCSDDATVRKAPLASIESGGASGSGISITRSSFPGTSLVDGQEPLCRCDIKGPRTQQQANSRTTPTHERASNKYRQLQAQCLTATLASRPSPCLGFSSYICLQCFSPSTMQREKNPQHCKLGVCKVSTRGDTKASDEFQIPAYSHACRTASTCLPLHPALPPQPALPPHPHVLHAVCVLVYLVGHLMPRDTALTVAAPSCGNVARMAQIKYGQDGEARPQKHFRQPTRCIQLHRDKHGLCVMRKFCAVLWTAPSC